MKVELELSDQHEIEIARLMKKAGLTTKAEFFTFAVNLYLNAINRVEEGMQMVFRDPINNRELIVISDELKKFEPFNDNLPDDIEGADAQF